MPEPSSARRAIYDDFVPSLKRFRPGALHVHDGLCGTRTEPDLMHWAEQL